MSGDDKQLELEALAAVGEMLLFDQARGNPEEAARILRCARLFARSEDAAQRLSELCNEAGSDATWRENIVEELQDREDLQAAEAAMEARRQAQLVAQADSADTALQTLMDEVAADTFGSLDEGYAPQAQAEAREGVAGQAVSGICWCFIVTRQVFMQTVVCWTCCRKGRFLSIFRRTTAPDNAV
ncbi:antitoxin MazE-like protein [Citrobacter freundii]